MAIIKIIGLSLCAIGALLMWHQWRKMPGSDITDGRVIELIPVRGSKGKTNYKVRAEYLDREKHRYEYVSSWSSSPAPYDVGEVVRIMFDKEDHSQASICSFGARFGIGWVMLGIGLLILWCSFGFDYGNAYLKTWYPNTF